MWQDVNLFTVDIEKHSMGIGLRCWPTNVDYNGKDSASVATYANNGAAGAVDMETHCSADSLQRLKGPPAMSAPPDNDADRNIAICGVAVGCMSSSLCIRGVPTCSIFA